MDFVRHLLYCADELIPAPAALTAAHYPLTRGVHSIFFALVSSEKLPERSNRQQPYCRGSDRSRGKGVTVPEVGGECRAGGHMLSGQPAFGHPAESLNCTEEDTKTLGAGTCTRSPSDDVAPASGGQAGLISLDSGNS